MGFDDLVNKGKEAFEQNKDKIDDALHSEQAESISDSVLDKGEQLAEKVGLGDQAGDIRENLDDKIGNE
ncbi:hypothetical protein [Microbacterium karelineae]|uniref:hypothetical protein n=1 Tax=Microbacterium karelineae TaxID=2654283 RepID=UPI0012EABE14|nr:hypothetical protein [Microbacterium karelineae]